jgi:hypothetical protein
MELQVLKSASKILSENDLGLNNSHQAGFLIPKNLVNEGLFDRFREDLLNPRVKLTFIDRANSLVFHPTFIHYNNRFFAGTRNEYRLTGLKRFMRENLLKPGDSILISRVDKFNYEIEAIKTNREPSVLSSESWIMIYGKEGV